jgi:hypothetical protein
MKKQAKALAKAGRYGDDSLVHMNKREIAALEGIASLAGRRLTKNPKTGATEAFNLFDILPLALNFIAPGMGTAAQIAISAASGAASAGMEGRDPLTGALMGGITSGIAGNMFGPSEAASLAGNVGADAMAKIPGVDAAMASAMGMPAEQATKIAADAAQAAAKQGANIVGQAPLSNASFMTDIFGAGSDAAIDSTIGSLLSKQNLPLTLMGASMLAPMLDQPTDGSSVRPDYRPNLRNPGPAREYTPFTGDYSTYGQTGGEAMQVYQPGRLGQSYQYTGSEYEGDPRDYPFAKGGEVSSRPGKYRKEDVMDWSHGDSMKRNKIDKLTIDSRMPSGETPGFLNDGSNLSLDDFAYINLINRMRNQQSQSDRKGDISPESLDEIREMLNADDRYIRLALQRDLANKGYEVDVPAWGGDVTSILKNPPKGPGYAGGGMIQSRTYGQPQSSLPNVPPLNIPRGPGQGGMASRAPNFSPPQQQMGPAPRWTPMDMFNIGTNMQQGRGAWGKGNRQGQPVGQPTVQPPAQTPITQNPNLVAGSMGAAAGGGMTPTIYSTINGASNNDEAVMAYRNSLKSGDGAPQINPGQQASGKAGVPWDSKQSMSSGVLNDKFRDVPQINPGLTVGTPQAQMTAMPTFQMQPPTPAAPVDRTGITPDPNAIMRAQRAMAMASPQSPAMPAFARGGIASVPGKVDPGITQAAMSSKKKDNGPRFIGGDHKGMDDTIPAKIDGKTPAKLSSGEFVIPADVVSMLGDGNTAAGARALREMMQRIRVQKTGNGQQAEPLNEMDVMPA